MLHVFVVMNKSPWGAVTAAPKILMSTLVEIIVHVYILPDPLSGPEPPALDAHCFTSCKTTVVLR